MEIHQAKHCTIAKLSGNSKGCFIRQSYQHKTTPIKTGISIKVSKDETVPDLSAHILTSTVKEFFHIL